MFACHVVWVFLCFMLFVFCFQFIMSLLFDVVECMLVLQCSPVRWEALRIRSVALFTPPGCGQSLDPAW